MTHFEAQTAIETILRELEASTGQEVVGIGIGHFDITRIADAFLTRIKSVEITLEAPRRARWSEKAPGPIPECESPAAEDGCENCFRVARFTSGPDLRVCRTDSLCLRAVCEQPRKVRPAPDSRNGPESSSAGAAR